MVKFLISRTSEWGDNQPHKNAYRDSFTLVDERVIDNPNKFKHKKDREGWYNRGSNHRVENGHIKRDFQDEGWFIDISSLEDILKFKKEVDENIIIKNSWVNKEILEIEIYDNYRE